MLMSRAAVSRGESIRTPLSQGNRVGINVGGGILSGGKAS